MSKEWKTGVNNFSSIRNSNFSTRLLLPIGAKIGKLWLRKWLNKDIHGPRFSAAISGSITLPQA